MRRTIGVIVIILILGLGGWWYLVGSRLLSVQEDKIGTQVQNETANWKTYRNEKYGFEIKHPDGWEVLDGGNGFYLAEAEAMRNNQSATIDFPVLKFEIDTPQPYYATHAKTVSVPFFQQEDSQVPLYGADERRDIIIKFNLGPKLIYANCNFGPKEVRFITSCNRIISTLKVMSLSTVADETANWKTYKNLVTGLEFRYPPDWPDPVSPPDRAPFNFPENEMRYGNGFFVALIEDAYIEFRFTGDNTSSPLTLSQKRNIFCNDNCDNGVSKTGISYLIMNLETERKGRQIFIEIGPIINSYEVKFNFGSPEDYEKRKAEFELLLSTLKTTADRQIVLKDEIVNRKTYRNEELGFSIRYPSDWKYTINPDGITIVSFRPENGPREGEIMKVYKNRLSIKANSAVELKKKIDDYNREDPSYNPARYKSVVKNIGGFDVVLVEESTGYVEQGLTVYILFANKDVLEFSGDIRPIFREMFESLNKL